MNKGQYILSCYSRRWLRLLFGREFTLLDLLALWDAIFADSDRFDLPNYIVVAMLIRIRDKCKYQMDISCLQLLPSISFASTFK